jgi:hypothetical protein
MNHLTLKDAILPVCSHDLWGAVLLSVQENDELPSDDIMQILEEKDRH